MIFYLVRHGEIDSNIKKVYAGWSEEGLTEKGVRQAEEAGKVLTGKGIGALYCSPLRRAVRTAEIIGGIIGKEPISDDSFKEIKLGPWEGLSEDEIGRKFPEEWRVWNARPGELKLKGRETLGELQERVLEGIRNLSPEKGCLTQRRKGAKGLKNGEKEPRVVAVTHVAIIRVLMLYSEGRDLNEYKQVPVPGNGEVFTIQRR